MNSKRKIEINIIEVQTHKILIQISSIVKWVFEYKKVNFKKNLFLMQNS